MSGNIKFTDAIMHKGKRKLFSKRFTPSNGSLPVAKLSAFIARVVAEDANTAHYVNEYNNGNYTSRADYIDYMANRIEFELKKAGIGVS